MGRGNLFKFAEAYMSLYFSMPESLLYVLCIILHSKKRLERIVEIKVQLRFRSGVYNEYAGVYVFLMNEWRGAGNGHWLFQVG